MLVLMLLDQTILFPPAWCHKSETQNFVCKGLCVCGGGAMRWDGDGELGERNFAVPGESLVQVSH